jgi:hypothetical protein
MRSYQNIVEIILEIAKKHKWIQHVDAGDVSEKEDKLGFEYPFFFLNYDQIVVKEQSKIYNFEFIVADKVTLVQSTTTYSNQLQVLSDCDAALTDIVSYLFNLDLTDVIISFDITATPFLTGLVSGGAGMIYNVSIETPYSKNSCDSMIKNVVLPE